MDENPYRSPASADEDVPVARRPDPPKGAIARSLPVVIRAAFVIDMGALCVGSLVFWLRPGKFGRSDFAGSIFVTAFFVSFIVAAAAIIWIRALKWHDTILGIAPLLVWLATCAGLIWHSITE